MIVAGEIVHSIAEDSCNQAQTVRNHARRITDDIIPEIGNEHEAICLNTPVAAAGGPGPQRERSFCQAVANSETLCCSAVWKAFSKL